MHFAKRKNIDYFVAKCVGTTTLQLPKIGCTLKSWHLILDFCPQPKEEIVEDNYDLLFRYNLSKFLG